MTEIMEGEVFYPFVAAGRLKTGFDGIEGFTILEKHPIRMQGTRDLLQGRSDFRLDGDGQVINNLVWLLEIINPYFQIGKITFAITGIRIWFPASLPLSA